MRKVSLRFDILHFIWRTTHRLIKNSDVLQKFQLQNIELHLKTYVSTINNFIEDAAFINQLLAPPVQQSRSSNNFHNFNVYCQIPKTIQSVRSFKCITIRLCKLLLSHFNPIHNPSNEIKGKVIV